MTQTLDDIRSSIGGGFTVLPPGTRNFTLTAAKPAVREYDNARILRISLSSSTGDGSYEISLAPWTTDENGLAAWRKLIVSWADGLGLDISDLDGSSPAVFGQISDRLAQHASRLVGAVTEVSVVHSTYDKKDGTLGNRVKAYCNSLVRKAPDQSSPSGAETMSVGDLQRELAPLMSDGSGWSTKDDNAPF